MSLGCLVPRNSPRRIACAKSDTRGLFGTVSSLGIETVIFLTGSLDKKTNVHLILSDYYTIENGT